MIKSSEKLIVALDVDSFQEARSIVDTLGESVKTYKVGSQLFSACGPVVIHHLLANDKNVFLDLKYHDIPNTVAQAIKSAVHLGVAPFDSMEKEEQKKTVKKGIFMITVHIQGGEEMLRKAVEAALKESQSIGVTKPLIVGITVLTSDPFGDNIQNTVHQRAQLAKKCGLDGVVSSPHEAAIIRDKFGDDFVIVTPGIRPKGSQSDDQKRTATAFDALSNGSHFLVVGRPIVQASDPLKAALQILEEISQALKL